MLPERAGLRHMGPSSTRTRTGQNFSRMPWSLQLRRAVTPSSRFRAHHHGHQEERNRQRCTETEREADAERDRRHGKRQRVQRTVPHKTYKHHYNTFPHHHHRTSQSLALGDSIGHSATDLTETLDTRPPAPLTKQQ